MINARELLAVERSLHHFCPSVSHATVAVFADNSMAVAYLRNAGGSRSPALNTIAQRILLWSELHHIRIAPQFITGKHNVLADFLPTRPDRGVGVDSTHGSLQGALSQVAGHGRPFCYLSKSLLLHLFLALPKSSGDGDRCSPPVLGPPLGLLVPSLGYASSGSSQALLVLQSDAHSDRSLLVSEAVVSRPSGSGSRPLNHVVCSSGSPQPTLLSSLSLWSP